MIEFHGDGLVPPELCRLLCLVVPKKDHVPVRFFNRHNAYGEPTRAKPQRYVGPSGVFMLRKRPWVGINLNALYSRTMRYSYHSLASSTAMWRALLDICLHEFGHAATRRKTERPNRHEYYAKPWGRVYRYTEQLADDWKDRRVARILKHDPRLRQPRRLTGYLGARLARQRTSLRQAIYEHENVRVSGPVYAAYVKEQRCWRTGAQLACGDVLRELGLEPRLFANAYRVLRGVSEGVGVDYMDGAGRRHKLYTWGDVPILAQRMEKRLDRLVPRDEPVEYSPYPGLVDGSGGALSDVRPESPEEAAEWDYIESLL